MTEAANQDGAAADAGADKTKTAGDANADKTKTDGDAAGGGGDKGAAGAAGPYKPEGIGEHFLGKDDKETIDKLNNAVIGFRKDLSKKGVPETADGYTLELPDDIKAKVLKPGEDGKDPVLEKLKPILHKNNIPAAAFQELAKEFYGVVAEMADGIGKTPDGKPLADFEYKDAGGAEKAKPLVEGAQVWIGGLLQNKKISDKTAAELKMMTSYGEGLAAVMELRTAMGGKPIPKNLSSGAPEGITKEMLDARVADKKYWLDKDPQFIRETTEMFQKLYSPAA